MKWYYDACGTYTEYKGYTIIKQEHPNLERYAIYMDCGEELQFIATASNVQQFKEIINDQFNKYELAQ